MKKILFFAAAAAAVLATGGSKEDGTQSAANEGNAIEFRGVVDKGTRASTVATTNELTNFFVHGTAHTTGAAPLDLAFMNAPVYKNGTAWTYAPAKYFPANGDLVNFYAYAPIKDINMTDFKIDAVQYLGLVAFKYTVPADQRVDNTAVDLLVASAYDKTAGNVALSFSHALSGVTFSAKNVNPKTGPGSDLTYVITDIKLVARNNGTYAYARTAPQNTAAAFTPSGVATSYIAGLPESGVPLRAGGTDAVAKKLLSNNDIMMVIPQATTAAVLNPDNTVQTQGVRVQVTYSVYDSENFPIITDKAANLLLPQYDTDLDPGNEVLADFKFDMGKLYNFEFTFGDPDGGPGDPGTQINGINFTVTQVSDWDVTTPIELPNE